MPATPALLLRVALGAVALFTLVESAEVAIDRLLRLAQRFDVPDVLVGMTVLALGTSLPEISAHVIASLGILAGTLDYRVGSAIVLGGNMGSSTAQQTLLFGLFLVGYGRFEVSDSFLRANYVPMVLALLVTLGVAWDGTVSRLDGLLLLAGYAVYVYYSFSRRERSLSLPETASANVRRDALVTAAALGVLILSAQAVLLLVEDVVARLRLGGSMVGVITLGVAAALPELSTVVNSIRRRAPNVALGTLVGSNVVNPLVGIGLGGVISTYRVPAPVVLWDLPFKILVALALYVSVVYLSEGSVTRRDGFYLVVAYFAFLSVRLLVFPGQ
jgi:cation:H+ antiporter